MTQADSARALRMSLDSSPTLGVEPAANPHHAAGSLPKGWASFCSNPDPRWPASTPGRWYATAPWDRDKMHRQHGGGAIALEQTVTADTWAQLCAAVQEQADLYETLTEGAE